MIVDLVRVTTEDGVRLDGVLQAAGETQDPSLPVDAVLCVHGTGGNFYNSRLLESVAERLVGMGIAALRINTRGRDPISTAVTSNGGRRLGAAYEIVDDCRHDLAAWMNLLRDRGLKRVAVLGHSLGAVKALYATIQGAIEPDLLIAVSPPRLSSSWYLASRDAETFRTTYKSAEEAVSRGDRRELLDVKFPLPMILAAETYVEKYGPDERYNFLQWIEQVKAPTLFTFGGRELEQHVAFGGSPEEIAEKAAGSAISTHVVAGADHFYTDCHHTLLDVIERWLIRGGARPAGS